MKFPRISSSVPVFFLLVCVAFLRSEKGKNVFFHLPRQEFKEFMNSNESFRDFQVCFRLRTCNADAAFQLTSDNIDMTLGKLIFFWPGQEDDFLCCVYVNSQSPFLFLLYSIYLFISSYRLLRWHFIIGLMSCTN